MPFTSRALTWLGVATAHPLAFVVVGIYTLLWVIIQPHTLDWHGLATLATWLMTLLIQRAEHRDTQAIHGKLDELIRTSQGARNEVTRLDTLEPEEVERARRRDAG